MRARLKRLLARIIGGREPAEPSASAVAEVAASTDLARRNDSEDWARLYSEPIIKVTRLCSRIAREIENLTARRDLLLEAGCGSARISAELATAGRKIALCDFSQEILQRAEELFRVSGLRAPKVTLWDLNSRPFPWDDGAVDTVWSSGVLEHWTDEELLPIVAEMARISRKSVISLVPNSRSLFYRFGKHIAEKREAWPFGLELPRVTLRHLFEQVGLSRIREFTFNVDQSCGFLHFFDQALFEEAAQWVETLPADDPALENQGYLLLTVGYKDK